MQIKIPKRELHLAAYMKSMGALFVDYGSGAFIFDSDVREVEWRIRHSNSESLRVDQELFVLKAFFQRDS